MNEIVNNFLLAGDKFMPRMHLRQPGFTYSVCRPFAKAKKEYEILKKQEIRDVFIKTNEVNLVFNMTWLMEILNI